MADPSAISSAFLAGRTLPTDQIDVDNDLIPYFKRKANGEYELCVVTPAALYAAMSA